MLPLLSPNPKMHHVMSPVFGALIADHAAYPNRDSDPLYQMRLHGIVPAPAAAQEAQMLIQIRPPRPSWPADFGRIKAALLQVVPVGAVIHHIGSTAVPGLAAKDIIDVQVTLARLSDLDPAAMTGAGFNKAGPTCDHQPPGMTLAAEDLAKLMFRNTRPAANIHIREQGRFNQRYPLLCRDYLRAHPLAAAAYGAIKQQLASRFPSDAEAYYDIKDPVFDLIMVGAEDWAGATGWTPPPGD